MILVDRLVSRLGFGVRNRDVIKLFSFSEKITVVKIHEQI